jgi:hypothetical protein
MAKSRHSKYEKCPKNHRNQIGMKGLSTLAADMERGLRLNLTVIENRLL